MIGAWRIDTRLTGKSMSVCRTKCFGQLPDFNFRSRFSIQNAVQTALILMLLLPGCASFKAYPGPERQPSEIAIITVTSLQGFWLIGGSGVSINSVDGIPIVGFSEVHMEPGEHEARFLYVVTYFCGYFGCLEKKYSGSIRFIAQKGHRYRLDVNRREGETLAWITDKTSGQIVAGEKPVEVPSYD